MRYCVILSGGKSSRFGADKTLAKFGGCESLSEFCYQKFSKVFEKVFISAKSDKFGAKFPLLLDENTEFSPMNALFSILKNFKNEKIFIIPADMPFVEISSVIKLYENSANCDICVAKDRFHTHFLCGFFSSNLAQMAKNLSEKNENKIENLCKMANFKSVEFADDTQFLNINFQKDYENARLKFERKK